MRSLNRRGIRTVATSETPDAPAFSSRYCEETHVVPDPADDLPGYRDAMLSLARRPDVRTITPLREHDAYLLGKYREEFAEHVGAVWPDFETLGQAHDRVRMVEAARRAGVRAPETRLAGEVEDWNRPLVVKPRYSVLVNDYVESVAPESCLTVLSAQVYRPGEEPDVETLREEHGHEPIVQEYVPGEEYALWALYDGGEAVATCGKRQVRAFKYAGGTSIYRTTIHDPDLEAAGRALLDEMDWHGPASVQFKRDARTGEYTLLEVNPRFWVSLECAVQAGLDFPYLFWRLACGEPVGDGLDFEEGVGSHLLRGEAVYLLSVLRDDAPFVEPPSLGSALWSVAASLVAQPHFDYLDVRDPVPFVHDLYNVAADLV